MARLEAKEQVLFFPTPPNITNLIASNITPGTGPALDPCCGDGEPLAMLAARLGVTPYGNELHPGRYAQAKDKLFQCLNGAREFLDVEGRFSLLFNNPPYDRALSGQRMEIEQIRLDLPLLAAGGLGIWIVPETIINNELCSTLVAELSQVEMRRFPMPEYERFKQIVIFGNKRQATWNYTYSLASDLEARTKNDLPVLRTAEFAYAYPNQLPPTRFALSLPNTPQILAEIETNGVRTTDAWNTLFNPILHGVGNLEPMLPLSSGHTAFVIAAGIVDGIEIEIDGQPHLVKGSTTKEVQTTVEESGGETITRERERLSQTIAALDTEIGRMLRYNSLDDHEGFSEFLLSHQGVFVEAIERNHPPLFEPERDLPAWTPTLDRIHAPGLLPGQQTSNGLLPAQRIRAAALAKRLATDKAVILSGEMGSGKTPTSQSVMALAGQGNWKTVVICPSQVVEKWKREAEKVLRDFDITVHIIGEKRRQPDGKGKVRKVSRPVLDVQRAMDDPNPSLLIMSYQTAKNGARWEPAAWRCKRPVTEIIQIEGGPPVPSGGGLHYSKMIEVPQTKIKEVLCCPSCGKMLQNQDGRPITKLGKKNKLKCTNCKSPLWQQISFAYGGRVAIADHLNRRYSGQYNLIIDEAHKSKGADSDAGYAMADLVAGANKVLAMTGTLYAGKASSIFYLLYRLFPHFRQLYDYDEAQRFVEHHGLQEIVTKTKKTDSWNSSYGYLRENVRVRELPGVSPGMVTMLLNNTAFLKLANMGLSLPIYTEERYPIPLDPRLEGGLESIKTLHKTAVNLAVKQGAIGLLSQWVYLSLGWFDCPIAETLTAVNREGEVIGSYDIGGYLESKDQLLDNPLAKDETLLEIIEAELAQERGVGVFFAQVNRRDWMSRIQKALKKRGIYSEILRQSTAKPQDRERWYQGFVERCRERGQEPVLLANGNLVKEGLDLIELPTLIETGIEYRINDLRQRDRRSWRIIQDRPVKVIFLYYEDTWQEIALQLVAAKLKAALMVDGDLAEGLAAMNVDDGNLMDALMKAVGQGRPDRIEWSGMDLAQISGSSAVEQAVAAIEETGQSASRPALGAFSGRQLSLF